MMRSMTAEDVNEKSLGAEQCERLVTIVRNLDAVRNISSLVPLLTR
jgi:hypothetical protein